MYYMKKLIHKNMKKTPLANEQEALNFNQLGRMKSLLRGGYAGSISQRKPMSLPFSSQTI